MYLEHFQLKSQPFAEHAAVSSLWQDQRMDEGLARLDYLVRSGQLGLVTGPSGVGKSALLKRFLHGLLPPHCQAHSHAFPACRSSKEGFTGPPSAVRRTPRTNWPGRRKATCKRSVATLKRTNTGCVTANT